MSDPEIPQDETIPVITIRLLGPDNVQVSGPIANKILCYGMLERAIDAVREFKPPKSPIIPLSVVERFTKPFQKDS